MSLPILEFKSEIIEKLVSNQVLIVTGEPGCGKSTKIPQFCVDSKELCKKLKTNRIRVAVTQPRRVAAIAMAKRVAYERSCKLGTEVIHNQVGYCIRFEDYTSSKTCIKYMTDGVLLKESLSEAFNSYSIIILDEAHERSLDTDILLALLKSYLPKNKYFRLIVTSATIDIQLFSAYFNNCPVITIPGRQHPIEVLHSACKLDKRVEYTVNAAIRIHLHEGPGDVLAFLTGSDECERAKSKCFEALQLLEAQGNPVPSMLILSLYGAMSSEEQAKVFKKTPEDCRKVVFSTNISETSITIDGIGYVIDCGYVKQKQFNPKTSLEALMIVPISKQQSHQRAGRAGRTQAGKCFRLYSESFYEEQMPESSQAEIFRSNLASVILCLKILKIDLFTFEFLQSPDSDSIQHAIKQLYYISAIDDSGNLTPLGKQISKFPLDPSFARSLISSLATNCSEEMTSLVSLLSSEHIWRNISKSDTYKLEGLKKTQTSFCHPDSDHLMTLKIFQAWYAEGKSARWSYENYINNRALLQADDIRHQLKRILKKVKIPSLVEHEILRDQASLTTEERLRLSLCAGFFMNAAREIELGQIGSYLSVRDNSMLHIDKSSSIYILSSYPKWLIYTQLSGSSLTHGTIRMLSKVKSKWLQYLLPRLNTLDPDKLFGFIGVKRTEPEPAENQEEVKENIQQKIESAKERYLKRRGNR